MKIVLANNYFYLRGGSERVLVVDRLALAAAGQEVRVFSPQDTRNFPVEEEKFFPRICSHTAVGRTKRLRAALGLIYSRPARKAFAKILDVFNADVIHCHNIYGRLTSSILDEARIRGIPVVMTLHDLKLVCPAYLGLCAGQPCHLCVDGSFRRCVQRRCHKQSISASLIYAVESYFNRLWSKYDTVARFLCPSRFLQNLIVKSGVAQERILYHPNAVPVSEYIPCYEPGPYILYVGRLSHEKGLLTLLEAIGRAKIPLRIAGTGPLEPQIRQLILDRGLPVTMDGFCDREQLAALYRGAAFTVLPSEWYENAPMSVLESFSYGKPVLASEIGGNSELVTEGQTGRLFSAGNSAELVEAASKMWTEKDNLKRMGKSARHIVEERFTEQRRLASLLTIYDGVIAPPGVDLERTR